jgi:hypothetical protein
VRIGYTQDKVIHRTGVLPLSPEVTQAVRPPFLRHSQALSYLLVCQRLAAASGGSQVALTVRTSERGVRERRQGGFPTSLVTRARPVVPRCAALAI